MHIYYTHASGHPLVPIREIHRLACNSTGKFVIPYFMHTQAVALLIGK